MSSSVSDTVTHTLELEARSSNLGALMSSSVSDTVTHTLELEVQTSELEVQTDLGALMSSSDSDTVTHSKAWLLLLLLPHQVRKQTWSICLRICYQYHLLLLHVDREVIRSIK